MNPYIGIFFMDIFRHTANAASTQ